MQVLFLKNLIQKIIHRYPLQLPINFKCFLFIIIIVIIIIISLAFLPYI